MVQEFHVVRCFSCQTFQVQQVKKVNKWSCKLCGEKQSLLKEFGRGSGIDCRRHVQKLNAMRGVLMEEQECNAWSLWEKVEADEEDDSEEQRDDLVTTYTHTQTQVSCWSKYLDTSNEDAEPEKEKEENVLMDREQPVIDRKRKRREEWTNRRGLDSRTPEQSNWSSLVKRPVKSSATNTTTSPPSLRNTSLNTSPPSLNTTSLRSTSLNNTRPPSLRSTSLNNTRPPSLNNTSLRTTSLNNTSPPSKKSVNTPSVNIGPVSRWSCFLNSDRQVNEEGEELSVSGRSQSMCEAASLSHNDTVQQTPPLARPCPMLPVSSMFQSGDDFNFDDEFFSC